MALLVGEMTQTARDLLVDVLEQARGVGEVGLEENIGDRDADADIAQCDLFEPEGRVDLIDEVLARQLLELGTGFEATTLEELVVERFESERYPTDTGFDRNDTTMPWSQAADQNGSQYDSPKKGNPNTCGSPVKLIARNPFAAHRSISRTHSSTSQNGVAMVGMSRRESTEHQSV